jgi:phosphate-selective porin OprO/OprP
MLRAAVVVTLLGPAASLAAPARPSIAQQIEALRALVERQQAELEAQRRELDEQRRQMDAQRAALAALRADGQAEDGARVASAAASAQSATAGAAPAAASAGTATTTEERLAAVERDLARARLSSQEAATVRMTANRPTIAGADGRSTLAVRANVQLDYAHHDQAGATAPAVDFRRGSVGVARENDAARDLSDGAYFRRARLGVEGTIARDFTYRFLAEFGGAGTEGPTRINDAYVGYTGFAPFTIQLGAFSPPANLADGTSTEDLPFIERASAAEISRALGGADGRLGFGIRGGGARWFASMTYTARTVNDAEVFDAQRAFVGRLAGLAYTSVDANVHLGINGTRVVQPADQSLAVTNGRYAVRFRDRPEIRVDSTRLIDTGGIDADAAYAAGLEFAANWRNFEIQGERFRYGVDRRASTLPDPRFGGWYVEGTWVITGEPRRYSIANAAFQAPRPRIPFDGRGGWGAWELALRYSVMDLNYHEGLAGTAAATDAVRGGKQAVLATGLNWYLNGNVKLMIDWLHVDVDRLNPASPGNLTPFGATPATPPLGAEIGQSLNVYALRSQFSF